MDNIFFSKITLRKSYSNQYDLHQSLWYLFPDIPDAKSHFLFSVENKTNDYTQVILFSKSIPQTRVISDIQIKSHGPYALQSSNNTKLSNSIIFEQGSSYRFKLTANPTKKISDPNGKKNKKGEIRKLRIALYKENERVEWLRRKLSEGAEISELFVKNLEPVYFKKKGQSGKVVPAHFEGLIRVTDENKFKELWLKGIGPAKAFGCGLLLLKRV